MRAKPLWNLCTQLAVKQRGGILRGGERGTYFSGKKVVVQSFDEMNRRVIGSATCDLSITPG